MDKTPDHCTTNVQAVIWINILAFLSILSIPYARAAETQQFHGSWGKKWCGESNPGPICGGFYVYLTQEGSRICGAHYGADARANRMDDGVPGSIIGTVVGSTAVLVITSERNHSIYLAKAERKNHSLDWKIIQTVKEGDNGEPAFISDEDILTRHARVNDLDDMKFVEKGCREKQQISSDKGALWHLCSSQSFDSFFKIFMREVNVQRTFTRYPLLIIEYDPQDLEAEPKTEYLPFDLVKFPVILTANELAEKGVKFEIREKGTDLREVSTYSIGSGAYSKNYKFEMIGKCWFLVSSTDAST